MTGPKPSWAVVDRSGLAHELHHRPFEEPARRLVTRCHVPGPAVVLGSAQRGPVVDASAAMDAGVEVARRRSGGGAVWLDPADALWVDVDLPAGDVLWSNDVGKAFHWLGETWQRALGSLGIQTSVHVGPLLHAEDGRVVCFAGTGPGEVLVDGAKVVGISQRRTRLGARFQCVLYRRWAPGPLLNLLDLPPEQRNALAAVKAHPIGDAKVFEAFLAALPTNS